MYLRKYGLFLSLLCVFVDSLPAHDFTNGQWEKIEHYVPKRLVEKLKKAISHDYDEEYREKYSTQQLLVKDRVAAKIAEKVDAAEQQLLAQVNLDAEKIAQYHAVKKTVGSTIDSESFPGIWMKNEDGRLIPEEDDEHDTQRAMVRASVKKCMPLLDINSIVISKLPLGTTAMGIEPMRHVDNNTSVALTGDEIPCLYYDNSYVTRLGVKELDSGVAHELSHAKFRHCYDFPEYLDCHDAYHTLEYYQEKQADTHASLTFASEMESFTKGQLKVALRGNPLFNLGIKDNDPVKGYPNNDVHPSYLLRYIQALKIRKLLEAEQRWFASEEANERYGSVYYDRAWHKWATEQNRLTK